MTTLYELSKTVQQVILEVIDAEGDISGELEKRLDDSGMDFKEKSLNIGRWIKQIEFNEPGLDKEIKRLQKMKKSQTALKERLESYLKFCIESAGLNSVDLGTFTANVEKNPSSSAIDDETELPARYVKIEYTTKIDREGILRDLRAGKTVPGAHLVTDKTHLKLR